MLLHGQAHLKAEQFYSVVANMRGDSPEKVAASILSCQGLRGLQVLLLLLFAWLAAALLAAPDATFSHRILATQLIQCPWLLFARSYKARMICAGPHHQPSVHSGRHRRRRVWYSRSIKRLQLGFYWARFYCASICVPKSRLYALLRSCVRCALLLLFQVYPCDAACKVEQRWYKRLQ